MHTFSEWMELRGETRLSENISNAQNYFRKMWDERNDPASLHMFPAWELCPGYEWEESLPEWHARWQKCGGILSEGRMIAPKWDSIWEHLSSTFYDGLGRPYPPYARSSCARWRNMGQDEAIVVGAISEAEFENRMKMFPPPEPLIDKDGNPLSQDMLKQIVQDLEEEIYRLGGPPPNATRAERFAHERKSREERSAKAKADYEKQRQAKRDSYEEKDATFRLLEQIETSLFTEPTITDKRRSTWLHESLATLLKTPYFDQYPNWRARTWLAYADLYKQLGDPVNELRSLREAITINPKLSVKKRIKSLLKIPENGSVL